MKKSSIRVIVCWVCVAVLAAALVISIEMNASPAVTLTANGYRIPPTTLISSAQDLTAGWVDLGSEIMVDGNNYLALWINLDINASANARVRVLVKTEYGGTDEFVMPIKTVGSSDIKVEGEHYEFNVDADQKMVISVDLDNLIPWVQVQVQAGTVGGTAGQIDGAWYSAGK